MPALNLLLQSTQTYLIKILCFSCPTGFQSSLRTPSTVMFDTPYCLFIFHFIQYLLCYINGCASALVRVCVMQFAFFLLFFRYFKVRFKMFFYSFTNTEQSHIFKMRNTLSLVFVYQANFLKHSNSKYYNYMVFKQQLLHHHNI